MATIEQLRQLSLGVVTSPVSAQPVQTVIVQNPTTVEGSYLGSDEATLEVTPTQAVALDNASFSRTNAPKLRWNFDTRPIGVTSEQNITLMSDLGPENFADYPSLTALTSPHFGFSTSNSRVVNITTTAGSPNIASPTNQFLPSDVGSTMVSTAVTVGSVIIAYVSPALVTISGVGDGTGTTATLYSNADYATNGALINTQPGGPIIAELNKKLEGGSVVSRIVIRFDNTVAANAALASLPITLFHLPVDTNDTLVQTTVYDPFCDFCVTSSSGSMTTHAYNFNGPTTFRDGINIEIPDNTFGTLEIGYGIINLPNTLAATASNQWL